jgi:hypothetical protein
MEVAAEVGRSSPRGARFAVDATRRPGVADPDFDPTPVAPTRLRDFDPRDHQRLVINPFLAFLGLLGEGWLARALFLKGYTLASATIAAPFWLLPWLIQYHCLDCGQTGPYPRHRRHACPAVVARWLGSPSRRWPFPTPWAQVVVWGWVLGALGVLAAVLASG